MTNKIELNKEILNHTIELLTDNPERYEGVYGCDLHNELFNMDYYVIGYYNAEKFLNRNGGSFKAIHRVKRYEEDMFGEASTDLSDCEKVANMLAYIEGELVLVESETLGNKWNDRLSLEDIEDIIDELQMFY